MATVLVGNTYIGASTDSGAPTAAFGYNWFQSDTGNLYVSSTVPQWIYMGNANANNLGNLPLSGANMTGALTGAHGLMPLASGNFTQMPTVSQGSSQLPLVTQSYVDQRDNYVLSQISPQVQQALSSIPQVSITANQTIISGVLSPASNTAVAGPLYTGTNPVAGWPSAIALTIPQPYYADGSTPALSEMNVLTSFGTSAGFVPLNNSLFGSMTTRANKLFDAYVLWCPNPTTTPLLWLSAWQDSADSSFLPAPMSYLVICTKTGS